jgi:hypothetical protein
VKLIEELLQTSYGLRLLGKGDVGVGSNEVERVLPYSGDMHFIAPGKDLEWDAVRPAPLL